MHGRGGRILGATALVALSLSTPARVAQAQEACDPCRTGRNQSPVRLVGALDAPAAPGPAIGHAAETATARDNGGKNLLITFPAGSRNTLTFDGGAPYTLVEFHFHAPGEHPASATAPPPPLEAHFVHERAGVLAVVGVPIQVGAHTHPALARVLEVLPAPGAPRPLPGFDPSALSHHRGRKLLRYSGSLTTGTCDEGVSWFFYDAGARPVLTISAPDLARYTARFPPYARDPQPLHARVLVRTGSPTLVPRR